MKSKHVSFRAYSRGILQQIPQARSLVRTLGMTGFGHRSRSRFIYDLAADDGHLAAGLEDLRLRDLHDVCGENGKVRELADFDAAADRLLERGYRRPDGEHSQCILARDGLLGVPAFAGFTLEALARRGSVEFDHRLAALDRRVRAAGDDRARSDEAFPCIRPRQPLNA